MGGEVKGKLMNGVGSQYPHTTWERGVSSISNADTHTSAASSRMNWLPPADLNGLVRFGERRNVVSARVPSGSARALTVFYSLSERDHAMSMAKWWNGEWQGETEVKVKVKFTLEQARRLRGGVEV